MGTAVIVTLKAVIVISLIGSVVVQAGILPAVWRDLSDAAVPVWGRVLLVSVAAAFVVTMQVFAVCVWRLLTLVRRGSVFSPSAFGYVNVIIGTFAAASVLTFVLAVALVPGEAAPGVVGLICGASLVLAGIALLVTVMRSLLVQATARESEVRALRSELDEVV